MAIVFPDLRAQAPAYASAFAILSEDLRYLTEYVEPTDANLTTYSHRLYELLLRACTEWESICKDALVSAGSPKNPKYMDVNDYKTLEPVLQLESVKIGLVFWRPQTVAVQPYKDWSAATPPLSWYSAYNSVKHNRNSQFEQATLENVRLAVAAVFALHERFHWLPRGERAGTTLTGMDTKWDYPGQIFSFEGPHVPAWS